jgi:dTMP kinase
VILDRYYWSTAAYQGARGADVNKIIADNEIHAPIPDLILLLDLPPNIGVQRICGRGDTPNEFEKYDSLMRVREIFLGLHTRHDRPSVLIDASHDVDTVRNDAVQALSLLVNKHHKSDS